MSSKLFRTRRLFSEPLESRDLLSVSAVLTGGTLCITGNTHDNDVTVTQRGSQVIVCSDDWFGSRSFSKVTDLSVNLDGGNDCFTLKDISLKGCVSVTMGGANDHVTIGPSGDCSSPDVCIGGSLKVDLGSGCNTLCETSTSVKGDESICAGDGNDSVSIGRAASRWFADVQVCGSLSINLGCGDNTICETATSVSQCETIAVGDGKDSVNLGRCGANGCFDVNIGKDLAINLGAGNNCLTGSNVAVCGGLSVTACANGSNNPSDAVTLDRLSVGCDAVFSLLGCGTQQVSIGHNADPHDAPSCQENSIGGNLKITTGTGDDCIQQSSLKVGGCDTVCTDGGDDEVDLGCASVTVCKDLSVDLGKGQCNKELDASNVRVSGNFCITGDGNVVDIDLDDVVVAHLLSITTGKGCDSVSIGSCSKADTLQVSTDGGDDCVTIDNSSFNTANVALGSGDHDALKVSKTQICNACFDGGTGHYDTFINGPGNNFTHLTKKNFERYA